jgi:hypothetical protein
LAPEGKTAPGLGKFNPNHDERGRFATADGAGAPGAGLATTPNGAQVAADDASGTKSDLGESERSPASRSETDRSAPNGGSSDQFAFAGVLIDKRYDETLGVTHCTYRTPNGTYTIEYDGYLACPPTTPVPF